MQPIASIHVPFDVSASTVEGFMVMTIPIHRVSGFQYLSELSRIVVPNFMWSGVPLLLSRAISLHIGPLRYPSGALGIIASMITYYRNRCCHFPPCPQWTLTRYPHPILLTQVTHPSPFLPSHILQNTLRPSPSQQRPLRHSLLQMLVRLLEFLPNKLVQNYLDIRIKIQGTQMG